MGVNQQIWLGGTTFFLCMLCMCTYVYIYIYIPSGYLTQPWKLTIFPQQRKLMGSSAPVCAGAGAGSGSTMFRRVPKVPEKVWETLVHSQVTFNRVPEKVPEKVPEEVPGNLGAKPSQVQQGSGEGSGEGLGGFGAEPGQVQQGSGEGSGESVGGFGAEPGHVQQGSGEGSGEGVGGFGAEPGQVQQGSGEGSGEGSGRLWCRARSGSTGFRRRFREALVQSQVKFNRICGHLIHGNPAEVFPALGFAARFRQICKIKTLRLLGIPPKLIDI